MGVFQVRHGATGAVLWTGSAAGEIQALDAMAHEAGYYDHSDLPDSVRRGGLSVEALFGSRAETSAPRTVGGRLGQLQGRGGVGSSSGERAAVRSF